MAEVTATVQGVEDAEKKIAEALGRVEGTAQLALIVQAAAIAADAAQRAPIQTGALRQSVVVVPSGSTVAVGFTAPYAAEVHERTDVAHDEGEAKFLEHAMNEAAATMATLVAQKIKVGD